MIDKHETINNDWKRKAYSVTWERIKSDLEEMKWSNIHNVR